MIPLLVSQRHIGPGQPYARTLQLGCVYCDPTAVNAS